jgi:hypothetical protein
MEAAPVAAPAAPAPGGALADPPGLSTKAPRGGVSPVDPMARLEAAGIEDGDEPYEDLSELGLETPGQGEEGEGEQAEGEEKPPEERQLSQTNGKGTREQPLRHKELPADTFVELKTADGKRVVVSLKDAVSGTFMSRDMVDRHVSTAKETMTRAKQIAENSVTRLEQNTARLSAVLRDPAELVKTLLVHNEPVLKQVAIAYAKIAKDPSLRENLLAVIRREQLDAQERETTQRRRALEQQETETRELSQLQQELGPAYNLGLKDAGLIQLAKSPEGLPEDLKDEIRMRFDFVRQRNGGKITGEQMRACVVSAAKAAGYPKGPAQRPVPAPKAPEPTARPANGKRDWDAVPREVKMRDVDYLFRRR